MMVNVPQLLNLNIGEFEASADAWSGIAGKLNSARDAFASSVVDPLQSGKWKGDTGEAATKVCNNIRLDIEAVAIEVKAVQRFLEDVASGSGDGFGNLRTHQQNLIDLQQEVYQKGFHLRDDGSVYWQEIREPGPLTPEDQQRHQENNTQADDLERRVKKILKTATDIDDTLTRSLKVIFGDENTFRTEHRGRTTEDKDVGDAWAEIKLGTVLGYLRLKGWSDAANLLDHYFNDNNGDPVEIDANRLLNDVPSFQNDVSDTLKDVQNLPDGPFQTEWQNSRAVETESLNWYYALNNFDYRIVGEKNGDEITYHVEVEKRYDWGIPSEHRRDLSRGPVHFEQSEIARLNMVGYARDFDVHGRTGTMTSP